jgi:crossover junction endodeoxyribonuclease RuvC
VNVVMAIDPGVSGGIAVSAFGKTFCHAMPATDGDRVEMIRSFQQMAASECVSPVCVLEEVSGFVGKAQPGSAMFKFGEGYGFLKGVIQALGIKLVLVRPQVWQKAFGLGTASRCASKSEWKNKLKAEAQRRFPQLPVTLATADALLILEWVRAGVLSAPDIGVKAGRSTPHPSLSPIEAERVAARTE